MSTASPHTDSRRPLIVAALAATLVVSAALAMGSASSPSAEPPGLGRWDATVTAGPRTLAAWFELDGAAPALRMTFQPSANGPESIDPAVYADERLRFTSGYMGPFELRYDATKDRWTGRGLTVGEDAVTLVAVRAPELPERLDVVWGAPERLFDGHSVAGWRTRWGRDSAWAVEDSALTSQPNRGFYDDLVSLEQYMNFKLHLQYRLAPTNDSGVHLRGRYEIQLTDRVDAAGEKGQTGAVYGWIAPLTVAAKPAPEWNTLDAELVGRRLTLWINHTLVQDHVAIPAITGDALDANEGEPGPIVLQGYLGQVQYRDVVLTPEK